MALPDSVWYDEGNRDKLHDDLRANFDKVLAVINDRPSLKKHYEGCVVCQNITTVRADAQQHDRAHIPHRELLRRRKKFLLTAGALTKMLSLPQNAAILTMRITGEGDVLEITACSPDYEVVPYGSEPNIARVQVDAA